MPYFGEPVGRVKIQTTYQTVVANCQNACAPASEVRSFFVHVQILFSTTLVACVIGGISRTWPLRNRAEGDEES